MNRRARRVVIRAAALVVMVVAVLVVTNWATVRDHVEAWTFQLTRETRTIPPKGGGVTVNSFPGEELILRLAARQLHCKVIFDPRETRPLFTNCTVRGWRGDNIQALLVMRGYRVLAQRLPERAYVLIRSSDPTEVLPLPTDLLLEGLDLAASRIESYSDSGTR